MSRKFTKEGHGLGGDLSDVRRKGVGKPAVYGATKVDIVVSRLKILIGKLLIRLHVPGVIRPFRYYDPLTENKIALEVGALFTKLSVNGRDYYFGRLSGKWGGTGRCTSRHVDYKQESSP